MAFVLGTPTGEPGQTSRSQIIRIVSDLLRRETNLELQQLETEVIGQCRGQLGCLSEQTRRDYQRSALTDESGKLLRFETHVRRLREGKVPYTKYLLLVSNVTIRGQSDQISAVLIDTDLALQIMHESNRSVEDWQDTAEGRISASALVVPAVTGQLRGPDDAQVFFGRFFDSSLQPVLTKAGHWRPYGRIDVDSAHNGAAIFLDGQALGVTRAGITRIEKVDPGPHRLRIEHPKYQPWTAEFHVQRGRTHHTQARLQARVDNSSASARDVTFWTGAALATLGAGLTAYGIQRTDSGIQSACFDAPQTPCTSGTRFITFGYSPQRVDSGPLNPVGVMIVPLGYSLVGTGTVLGVGALLSEEEKLPWMSWAIGLAVGVVAYGVSAAVAGPLE